MKKNADMSGKANGVDPDQTAPRNTLIRVCNICSDQS